jgi:hypothetical protein
MSHATFNNISAISWQSVLLVEETGVHGKIHRPVASHRNNLVRIFIGWSNTKHIIQPIMKAIVSKTSEELHSQSEAEQTNKQT